MVFIFIRPVCCFKFTGLKRWKAEPAQSKQTRSLLAPSEWMVVIYVPHTWFLTTSVDNTGWPARADAFLLVADSQRKPVYAQMSVNDPNLLIKEVIWTHYQTSVCFLPPWLLHILQGSRVEDPRQLWLKGWYEEEERQNRTSATAWTVEQRVQAQTAARHPSQASILAAGASQLFNLGLLSRSSQDRTKETSTRHLQFMWYFFFFFSFSIFSLISSDRERGCAVLQYSLLFNIVVH